jgi:hypothetical protein
MGNHEPVYIQFLLASKLYTTTQYNFRIIFSVIISMFVTKQQGRNSLGDDRLIYFYVIENIYIYSLLECVVNKNIDKAIVDSLNCVDAWIMLCT